MSVANGSTGIGKSDAIGILLKPAVGVAVDDVQDSPDPLTLDKSEEPAVSRSGGTVSATTEESFDLHLTMVGCVSVEVEGGIELEKNFVIFEIRDLLANTAPFRAPPLRSKCAFKALARKAKFYRDQWERMESFSLSRQEMLPVMRDGPPRLR